MVFTDRRNDCGEAEPAQGWHDDHPRAGVIQVGVRNGFANKKTPTITAAGTQARRDSDAFGDPPAR